MCRFPVTRLREPLVPVVDDDAKLLSKFLQLVDLLIDGGHLRRGGLANAAAGEAAGVAALQDFPQLAKVKAERQRLSHQQHAPHILLRVHPIPALRTSDAPKQTAPLVMADRVGGDAGQPRDIADAEIGFLSHAGDRKPWNAFQSQGLYLLWSPAPQGFALTRTLLLWITSAGLEIRRPGGRADPPLEERLSTTRECGCVALDAAIESCYCALEPLVQAVGRRYALQVLNVIAARERTRFVEIQSQLGGMSSSTLAARLHELEEVKLIRRDGVGEDPPLTEYVLTPRGTALRESLRRLFRERDPFG